MEHRLYSVLLCQVTMFCCLAVVNNVNTLLIVNDKQDFKTILSVFELVFLSVLCKFCPPKVLWLYRGINSIAESKFTQSYRSTLHGTMVIFCLFEHGSAVQTQMFIALIHFYGIYNGCE